MKKQLPSLFKTTLAISILTLASPSANSANLVFPNSSTAWDLGINTIENAGGGISATARAADKRSYTGNPDLQNAAWGHFGSWYTFETKEMATTTISVTAADTTKISPAFTVWRTLGEFDGGTNSGEQNSAEKGTPHSFNQLGEAGDYGTWWMTDNSVNITDPNSNGGVGFTNQGITKTMGYANDGVTSSTQMDSSTLDFGTTYSHNGWGELLTNDGNQNGYAELTLANLEAGWYLVFLGGADGSLAGEIDLNLNISSVSTVPVPAAAYLFGSAMIGLFASSRRKLATTEA